MKRKWVPQATYLVPLGRIAVFYVPARKMVDSKFGRDGQTPTEIFDKFFLENFRGLTHEESQIRGEWISEDNQKVFTDRHQRYEVSFSGPAQGDQLLRFLAEMCDMLHEESIYLTIGSHSWLVTPLSKQTSVDPAHPA